MVAWYKGMVLCKAASDDDCALLNIGYKFTCFVLSISYGSLSYTFGFLLCICSISYLTIRSKISHNINLSKHSLLKPSTSTLLFSSGTNS